jgi:hypothetical protein
MRCLDNNQEGTDSDIRIRIHNKEDRENPYELFTAMGCYMYAVENFNRLIITAIAPDSGYRLRLEGVENGSIISKTKGVLSNVGNFFNQMVESQAIKEVAQLTHSNSEISEPKQVRELADNISKHIMESGQITDGSIPYVDPVLLAEVLTSISEGNKLLFTGESVEINNNGNVIPINTKFRSNVPASKMSEAESNHYRGNDTIKVVRPCNFGDSQWDIKSTITGDSYKVKFHKSCNWLKRYQNGEFPSITAKHTLSILVEYNKLIIGKNYTIRDAVIEKVSMSEDPSGEQIEFNY